MKLELSRQIFEKFTSIKFHENPLNGSRVVAAGWIHRQTDRRTDRGTDRQTEGQEERQTDKHTNRQADRHETQSRFSQFCETRLQRNYFTFNNHAYSLQHE